MRGVIAGVQVQTVVGIPPISVLINAASAEIYGLDVETALQVTDNLRISVNGAYVHSKYKSFPNAVGFNRRDVAPYSNESIVFDATGNQLPRAPKFTSNVAIDWTIPVGRDELNLTASWYHNGGFFWDAQNRLKEESYNLINAQVAYQFNDALKLRIWGRNLLDKKYYSYQSSTSFSDQGAPAAPLTYGLAIDYEF